MPLAGLNSVDFLVADDAVWLLEINPRPGATLDIFEPDGGSLFALHVQACGGVLPERVVPRRRVQPPGRILRRLALPRRHRRRERVLQRILGQIEIAE